MVILIEIPTKIPKKRLNNKNRVRNDFNLNFIINNSIFLNIIFSEIMKQHFL